MRNNMSGQKPLRLSMKGRYISVVLVGVHVMDMRRRSSNRSKGDIPLLFLATLALLARTSSNAMAEDLLGLYVGGAIGQSRVEATGESIYASGSVYNDTEIGRAHV